MKKINEVTARDEEAATERFGRQPNTDPGAPNLAGLRVNGCKRKRDRYQQ